MRLFSRRQKHNYITACRHYDPNFCIVVSPDEAYYEKGKHNFYFQFYNSSNYSDAKKVVRLDLKKPEIVHHRDRYSKRKLELTEEDKKILCEFLDSKHVWFNTTNWQHILFEWNSNAGGLMYEDFRGRYLSMHQAFIDGFFDTDKNMNKPMYLPSTLVRPDYTQI